MSQEAGLSGRLELIAPLFCSFAQTPVNWLPSSDPLDARYLLAASSWPRSRRGGEKSSAGLNKRFVFSARGSRASVPARVCKAAIGEGGVGGMVADKKRQRDVFIYRCDSAPHD